MTLIEWIESVCNNKNPKRVQNCFSIESNVNSVGEKCLPNETFEKSETNLIIICLT